jgi:hypothetical protein
VSRFGPSDPFYAAMAKAEHDDLMRRVLAMDVRYGCHLHQELSPPIIDRDPGDEDPSEGNP